MEMNIHEAKTNLSKLIAAMEGGERVVIRRAGKPVARLVPMEDTVTSPQAQQKREALFGCMKGKLIRNSDWESDLPDDLWEHNQTDPAG